MIARRFSLLSHGACRALLLGILAGSPLATRAQAPVTNQPVNQAPGDFRFAIVSDRAGGMRPGIFENAVTKLKMLQPEFVMSVGDLIDGYTMDPKVWDAQWQEFDQIIARLGLPFHYVPGNHDLSNPAMLATWKQHRGDPWSGFVYQNVLFLGLHTEDREGGGLSPEQITWVKKILAEHADVRWTMLFFHRPLWLEKDPAGYEQVAAALHGRSYTVFSGHLHHYLKGVRDGMNHYGLATTGGASKGRGVEFGEFDHVTWVTMKPAGPIVVNLKLDGILADDVVTEATNPRLAALRDGTWFRIASVMHPAPTFQRLTVPLRLRNPTDYPLHVSGQLGSSTGMRFEPAQIDHVVPPQQTDTFAVEAITENAPVSIHELNETEIRFVLTGSYEVNGQSLSLPTSQRLRLDWRHTASRVEKSILIDGDLGEWPSAAFTLVQRPMAIQENWDWSGPADGRFRFAVQQHDGKIYVAIETLDDRVITAADPATLQDKLLIYIRTAAGLTKLEAIAGRADAQAQVRATPTGLTAEFVFPLPPGEKTFRLNLGWQDHDRPENTKPSVLWWRSDDVTEFGVFTVEP